MVFDPIEVNTAIPYASLKLKTIQHRSECADNYKDIVQLKKLLYFFMKEALIESSIRASFLLVRTDSSFLTECDIIIAKIIREVTNERVINELYG